MKTFKEMVTEAQDDGYQKFMGLIANPMEDLIKARDLLMLSHNLVSYNTIKKMDELIRADALKYILGVVKGEKNPEVKQELKDYLGGYLTQARTFNLSKMEAARVLEPL